MKTKLLDLLKTVAPQIAMSIAWEVETNPDISIFARGQGLDGEDPDGWTCWQSTVTASAIAGGVMLEANAYLGGTWERYGDDPAEVNPEISGYLPQMAKEALTELALRLETSGTPDEPHRATLAAAWVAMKTCDEFMRAEWEAQQTSKP
jgi:hypothetical protein